MKWKLTGRFLMAIISIVILVILANTIMLLFFLINNSQHKLDQIDASQAEQFTRNLSSYMYTDNNIPYLNEDGLQLIDARSVWIQFLDSNGEVINQINAPDKALSHYTPIDLIQVYKYREFDGNTTVFIGEYEQYNYLVGIQDSNVHRAFITYSPITFFQVAAKYLLYVIIVDIFIALLVGLFFSSILTKPVSALMEHIQQLKNRNFTPISLKKPGIYKHVFKNIEDVSHELQAQEKERKKLEQMRNEWITNVSHDLKTPLASIQGYAELLQDADESEKQHYSAIIEQKAIYMHELLNDFTLALRLKNNQIPLHTKEIDIVVFMRELVIDILNNPKFTHRNVIFSSSISSFTKSFDPHLMKRAITNLIVNAFVHNTDDTSVEVRLSKLEQSLKLQIIDDGKGMSKEDVENVFERYYRGSYTDNVLGTGLGTAIARDIILAHQGNISLESELGKGTTITIML